MLLFPVLSTCVLAFPGDLKDAPPQNVLRTFEIASAAAASGGFRAGLVTMPMLGPADLETEGPVEEERDTSSVVELLRALNPKEWQYSGRALDIADDGRLVVRASNALHESTGRFLAFLEGLFARPIQLVVDVVTLPPGTDDASIPALMSAADAARFVSQARTGGTSASYALSLLPGVAAHVQAARHVQMVTQYGIEVAETSAAYDPLVEDVMIGTSIASEVAPSQGGLWLALVLADGAPLGEVESRDMHFQSMITTQDRPSFVSAPRQRQDVRLANRSVVLNSFVPDGKAIAVRSTLEVQGTRVTQIVLVHQEGASSPVFQRLPDDLKKAAAATDWIAIHGGSAAPPRAVSNVSSWDVPAWWVHRYESSMSKSGSIEASNVDSIANLIQPHDDVTEMQRAGPWIVLYRYPERTGEAASEEHPAGEDPLVVLGKYTPEARLTQVTLTLKRGDAVLAKSSLPARTGAKSSAVLGKEGFELRDFDVEIAKGVATSQPKVYGVFEGLVFTIEPRITNSGGLMLDIDANGRVRRGNVREFDAGLPTLAAMEQEDSDVISARRTAVFAKNESGPRRIVLGNAGSGADALSLEVEVADLR